MTRQFPAFTVPLLMFLLFNHACAEGDTARNTTTMLINCGGRSGDGLVSDEGLFRGYTTVYATNRSIGSTDNWTNSSRDAMRTHRWASRGDLEYVIPVTAKRAYNVTLYFAETWLMTSGIGKRAFTVSINGMNARIAGQRRLDVFQAAHGAFRAYAVRATCVRSTKQGFVRVKLGRIDGLNNPMISMIGIASCRSADKDERTSPKTPSD